MDDFNKKIRKDSGKVHIDDKLTCLLYVLMRDEITPGKIAEKMMNINSNIVYSNGWLAQYAKYLADELRSE